MTMALGLTAAVLAAGLAAGSPGIAAFAVPFALGLALNLSRRPRRVPEATVAVDDTAVEEGRSSSFRVEVANTGDAPVTAVLSAAHSPWLSLEGPRPSTALAVGPGEKAALHYPVSVLRWGSHAAGPLDAQYFACGGMLSTPVVQSPAAQVRALPAPTWFDTSTPVPLAQGVVGVHHSRRHGEGGELAEIRQFQFGDRLRRIDWRSSLRHGDLHVAQTLAEKDAHVSLILDAQTEAGASEGHGSTESLLDRTVRSGVSIGAHYLSLGDRLEAFLIGSIVDHIPPATGRRQLLRLRHSLAAVGSVPGDNAAPLTIVERSIDTRRRLYIIVTPLMNRSFAGLITRLVRHGHPVVCVDTLPEDVRPPQRSQWTPLAWRLWNLDRDNLIARLGGIGVPVVPWRGPGSIDAALRAVGAAGRRRA